MARSFAATIALALVVLAVVGLAAASREPDTGSVVIDHAMRAILSTTASSSGDDDDSTTEEGGVGVYCTCTCCLPTGDCLVNNATFVSSSCATCNTTACINRYKLCAGPHSTVSTGCTLRASVANALAAWVYIIALTILLCLGCVGTRLPIPRLREFLSMAKPTPRPTARPRSRSQFGTVRSFSSLSIGDHDAAAAAGH